VTDRFSPPNLVAIGLVLVFVSAIGWAITGGPCICVLPFGWHPQPTDLVLPLGLAAGLICIIGGIARILTD
jgi:exonuclease I